MTRVASVAIVLSPHSLPFALRCMPSLVMSLQDEESTREEAEGLANKCLLQDTGGAYRVHDLVLDFVKMKISAHGEMLAKATALQAQFLGRLDVVRSYHVRDGGTGDQGLLLLIALWRWVEKLSGDPGLEMSSYRATLGEVELCEATASVASFFHSLGCLYILQVRQCCWCGKSARLTSLLLNRTCCRCSEYSATNEYGERIAAYRCWGRAVKPGSAKSVRCLPIREKAPGPDHPSMAILPNNRARLWSKCCPPSYDSNLVHTLIPLNIFCYRAYTTKRSRCKLRRSTSQRKRWVQSMQTLPGISAIGRCC